MYYALAMIRRKPPFRIFEVNGFPTHPRSNGTKNGERHARLRGVFAYDGVKQGTGEERKLALYMFYIAQPLLRFVGSA